MPSEFTKNVEFRSNMDVTLIDHMGSDVDVCQAARVSTQGADSYNTAESSGLINFLMSNRHGTPFEHGTLKFLISAPIFVFREFHRHRIGWSYNEESGRYTQLKPVFYIPGGERNIVQVGKPGAYEYVPGDQKQYSEVIDGLQSASIYSYSQYQDLLNHGIAREVARMCLPVNIFSSMYATCNPRSLMSFLSLRTKSELSTFPSYPQREIEMVAEGMEDAFQTIYPETYSAFEKNGRVSP